MVKYFLRNLKHILKYVVWLFATLFFFGMGSSPLYSQNMISTGSGYHGFLNRFQLGMGYHELVEDYAKEDQKYYSLGYFISTQLGWAIEREFALYAIGSVFYSSNTEGPEIQERLSSSVGKTNTEFLLGLAGVGFSWFHVPSAFSISPYLHLFQLGRRTSAQKNNNILSGGDKYTLATTEVLYSFRSGYGLTLAKDTWVNHRIGIGFALTFNYDLLLLEKQTNKITGEPSGTEKAQNESDLRRVTGRSLLTAFSLNIIFN